MPNSPDSMVNQFRLDEEEQQDAINKEIFITVDNPESHITAIETFVMYRVVTKTTRSEFDSSEYEVRRRYQDFLWLKSRLEENYPTLIVHPLPEKFVMKGMVDRFNDDFIETRRKALHRFLNRISEHPILSNSHHFKVFLTEEELAPHRKHGPGFLSRMGETMRAMANSVRGLRSKLEEFAVMQEYVEDFSNKICSVDKVTQRIIKEQREYMDELKQYSPTYFQWAESEEELAEPLKGIGSCLERCSKETEEQIQQLSEVLVPALHEYVLCADTLKGDLTANSAQQTVWMRRHSQQCGAGMLTTLQRPSLFRTLSCREQLLIIYVSASPLNSTGRRVDAIQCIGLLQVLVLVYCFIRDRAADSAETPRRPSPQTPPPGGAQGVPRPAERHNPSSVSWASSRWDVPGTPPEEGVQETSDPVQGSRKKGGKTFNLRVAEVYKTCPSSRAGAAAPYITMMKRSDHTRANPSFINVTAQADMDKRAYPPQCPGRLKHFVLAPISHISFLILIRRTSLPFPLSLTDLTSSLTPASLLKLGAPVITKPSSSSGASFPEGLQCGSIMWRRSGLIPVQRIRVVSRGPAKSLNQHSYQDKTGTPGLEIFFGGRRTDNKPSPPPLPPPSFHTVPISLSPSPFLPQLDHSLPSKSIPEC
ncbi:hypothetical protein AMECASPLE_003159 [Ameca splendens]|uniref:PX domain-containing protein n=1 Tax=Ameca splendens TaxID=208324 RepID=A0ABV0ZKU0_9TELE